MKRRIITLGGLPGSGKSTVRKILAEQLGYDTFSTGEFVREMAHKKKMTLEELGERMSKDSTIDLFIDEKLKEINEHGDKCVVDAHLAFYFVPRGFNVYLNISREKAAERILEDAHSESRIKGGEIMDTLAEARKHTEWRIQNNIERYERLYGINPYQEALYEFCVDAEKSSPEKIAAEIISAYRHWLEE